MAFSLIIALVVTVVLLKYAYGWLRFQRRFQYQEISSDGGQYWNAFRVFIPLFTFPIVFTIFQIIVFILDFSDLDKHAVEKPIMIASTALFSLCPVVTVIFYFCGCMLNLREK